jgi:hypothetical protein
MLNKILKGTDRRSQIKLDKVLEMLGEKPNIAWYPSAGTDFRDLLEAETRTEISPDIYFHTDYMKDIVISRGTIFDDRSTLVQIMEINYLRCTDEINYHIDENFAVFADNAYPKPTILLLDVLLTYSGGEIRKPVLYWYFENINFLDEVLIKYHIPISHIVKVREGMGFGGNIKSIAISYAFLSKLKTQYLLIDNRADIDQDLIRIIRGKHPEKLKNFKLVNIAQRRNISDWSGYSVTVRRIEILDEPFTDENFQENLNQIRR